MTIVGMFHHKSLVKELLVMGLFFGWLAFASVVSLIVMTLAFAIVHRSWSGRKLFILVLLFALAALDWWLLPSLYWY